MQSNSHNLVVRAVVEACRSGDVNALATLLTHDVTAVIDGRGQVKGRRDVSRLLEHASPKASVSIESVNGQSGLAYRRSDQVVGVVALSVEQGLVDHAWVVCTPEKLRHWTYGGLAEETPPHNRKETGRDAS